jgi:two-component system, chemotaxis family, CheB/CheR fusion protein
MTTETEELADQRRRVLVVDDDPDTTSFLEVLLQSEGHDVHTARDGATALDLAAALRPDIVLLDLGLRPPDGFEVARELRRQERDEHVVMVALTGYAGEDVRQRCREAGFDGHLLKPIRDFDAFLEMVRTLALNPSGRLS